VAYTAWSPECRLTGNIEDRQELIGVPTLPHEIQRIEIRSRLVVETMRRRRICERLSQQHVVVDEEYTHDSTQRIRHGETGVDVGGGQAPALLATQCKARDITLMPGSQDFAADPRNADALVNLNGRLVARGAAMVSIFDGGFVVGDGVWEGLRLHKGALLFLDQHLDRLYWGAAKIRLDIGMNRDALTAELHRTLAANGMHDGVHLRVMVTRGEKSAPNQDPRNALGKATMAIVAEYKLPDPDLASRGLRLHTASIRCTPAHMFDMRLNSHSRLNLIMALLEAIDAGADEALMLDPLGAVSSCNATNFFCVREGEVRTSSGEYCFNGVTRSKVLELCVREGLAVRTGDFTVDEARSAEEAFVTGTFGGVTPVREIDGRRLSARLPGPVTLRLRSLYESLKNDYASAN
jgi:branched-chain amino acid aminotransferase